jgi:four helix bundle protein
MRESLVLGRSPKMPQGFEGLKVYLEARTLRKRGYRLTSLLPSKERFILFPQMRRAALSVTNCIAEGHGSRSYRHNISYLYRSSGSVCELQDDFNACQDEAYFKKEHLDDLRSQAQTVLKLLNGYVAHLRGKMQEAGIAAE